MKTNRSTRLRLLALAAALSLATIGASHAHAQADLTFSGGLGAPLYLTLNAPVSYVVTTAPSSVSPFFNFLGLGNVFSSYPGVSGDITFTINGGAAQTLSSLGSGYAGGDLASTDVSLFGDFPGVSVGDVVMLNAGTLTTTDNFADAAPSSGSYQTIISDNPGNKLDAVNGVSAAPEPSTWALLGLGVAGLGVAGLRRRARAA